MEFFNISDLSLITPLLILFATALLLMIVDAFGYKKLLKPLSVVGLLITALYSIPGFTAPEEITEAFNGMIWIGKSLSLFFIFLIFSAIVLIFYVEDFLHAYKHPIGDVYALITFALLGMGILIFAKNLIIVFIGIETLSIAFYILAGLLRESLRSNESALKYFLLGSFASSFIVFGIALLYGTTGTMDLEMLQTVSLPEDYKIIYFGGALLILVGFLFKVSAFPFHAWAPDVYTGSPTPLAGFLAAAGKLSVFIAMGLFLLKAIPPKNQIFTSIIILFAVLSMIYGNFTALRQTNIKRILAYSSIAHTGYVLLALPAGKEGYFAVVLYMTFYMMMTLGAFTLISALQKDDIGEEIDSWRGLGIKKPAIGFLMSVYMFSLAGMPPFAGFIGKYYVFTSAIKAGFIVPAIIGILTSVVAAYYYLYILVTMFFLKPKEQYTHLREIKTLPLTVNFIIALLLILLGVAPMLITNNFEILLLWNSNF